VNVFRYPPENEHRDHVLKLATVPANVFNPPWPRGRPSLKTNRRAPVTYWRVRSFEMSVVDEGQANPFWSPTKLAPARSQFRPLGPSTAHRLAVRATHSRRGPWPPSASHCVNGRIEMNHFDRPESQNLRAVGPFAVPARGVHLYGKASLRDRPADGSCPNTESVGRGPDELCNCVLIALCSPGCRWPQRTRCFAPRKSLHLQGDCRDGFCSWGDRSPAGLVVAGAVIGFLLNFALRIGCRHYRMFGRLCGQSHPNHASMSPAPPGAAQPHDVGYCPASGPVLVRESRGVVVPRCNFFFQAPAKIARNHVRTEFWTSPGFC